MPQIRARKAWIGQEVFDSIGERDRCLELRELERRHEIVNLTRQPMFVLQPRFKDAFTGKWIAAITYTADFRYVVDGPGGPHVVVEDYKGYSTRQGKLRIKMFRFQHQDIEFVMTGPASITKTGRKR